MGDLARFVSFFGGHSIEVAVLFGGKGLIEETLEAIPTVVDNTEDPEDLCTLLEDKSLPLVGYRYEIKTKAGKFYLIAKNIVSYDLVVKCGDELIPQTKEGLKDLIKRMGPETVLTIFTMPPYKPMDVNYETTKRLLGLSPEDFKKDDMRSAFYSIPYRNSTPTVIQGLPIIKIDPTNSNYGVLLYDRMNGDWGILVEIVDITKLYELLNDHPVEDQEGRRDGIRVRIQRILEQTASLECL